MRSRKVHGSTGDRIAQRSMIVTALAASIAASCLWALAADPQAVAAARKPATPGRLQGKVIVGSELSTKKIRFGLYPDLAQPVAASGTAAATSETENVVIYFESAPGLGAAPGAHAVKPIMRQEGLSFRPHVLAVPRGTTVEFPNGDPIFHNVFSLSRAASFDLGRYRHGLSKSVRFDEPGIVKVFCHIHSDMSAVVMVLDNGFFAIPDAQGRYAIDGIPPGEYTVHAWHERARPLYRHVVIEAGGTTSLDFQIPLTENPDGE